MIRICAVVLLLVFDGRIKSENSRIVFIVYLIDNLCCKILWGGEFCNFVPKSNLNKETMKKFLFLFAAVACVMFTNCSKDDDALSNSEPEITLNGYDEPYLEWGATKNEIRKSVSYELLADEADGLMYEGVDMVMTYIYLTGEKNSLYASAAMVKSYYAEELAEFLWTKYIPVMEKDGKYFAINKNQNMSVVLEIYSASAIRVTYFPVDLSDVSLSSMETDSLSSDIYELYDSLVRELEF